MQAREWIESFILLIPGFCLFVLDRIATTSPSTLGSSLRGWNLNIVLPFLRCMVQPLSARAAKRSELTSGTLAMACAVKSCHLLVPQQALGGYSLRQEPQHL